MKSLTEDFFLLRSNSVRRRKFNNEQVSYNDDSSRVLIEDVDSADVHQHVEIPSFVGQSEALQYQMNRLETKVNQLDTLHKRHIARPSFDEKNSEEDEIKAITREVSEMFTNCHHQIKILRRNTATSTGPESIITQNIVNYFIHRLQETSEVFSKSQNAYLNRLRSREEIGRNIFDFEEEDNAGEGQIGVDGWTRQSLLVVEDNSIFVRQREREIHKIVQSISELNTIFKDLANMVADQGTIIDRIDYNIEHAHMRVETGLKELKKAEKYQKQDRKMLCIIILAVIFIVLLFILVVVKS